MIEEFTLLFLEYSSLIFSLFLHAPSVTISSLPPLPNNSELEILRVIQIKSTSEKSFLVLLQFLINCCFVNEPKIIFLSAKSLMIIVEFTHGLQYRVGEEKGSKTTERQKSLLSLAQDNVG